MPDNQAFVVPHPTTEACCIAIRDYTRGIMSVSAAPLHCVAFECGWLKVCRRNEQLVYVCVCPDDPPKPSPWESKTDA